MQRISRAPVLSATRSLDSCWITSLPPRLPRAADDLLVPRVRLHRVDLDHDCLVHRARHDDPAALLAAAALVLGLGEPDDRAPLGRALALGLRVLVPLAAR